MKRINTHNAPKGYRAVASIDGCIGCSFMGEPVGYCTARNCLSLQRPDHCSVIYVPATKSATKTRSTNWRVEWTGPNGPCAVFSDVSPADAKAKAARYFETYDRRTRYRLIQDTVMRETIEIFRAPKPQIGARRASK